MMVAHCDAGILRVKLGLRAMDREVATLAGSWTADGRRCERHGEGWRLRTEADQSRIARILFRRVEGSSLIEMR